MAPAAAAAAVAAATDGDRPVAAVHGLRARLCAGAVGLVAALGLALQFAATHGRVEPAAAALWVMLRYFTILTNGLVAVVFCGIALGIVRLGGARLVAGTGLAVALVGVVFALLLHDLQRPEGGEAVADRLLHAVTPVAVPLWWLAFVPKGLLGRRDPLLWSAYPLLYCAYALARGGGDGIYPYPFLDVDALGPVRVALNALGIGAGFLAAGFALVALDGRLAARR